MKTPGFNAEASLYKTSGRYQATMYGIAPITGIVAQHSRPTAWLCVKACTCCWAGCPDGTDWCGICWWDCGGWEARGGGPWAG
jgi:hypothetical protein